MSIPEIEKRARRYAERAGALVVSCLGAGTQGTVFVLNDPSQSRRTAVKFHVHEKAFYREVGVYERLSDLQIDEVCGLMVPRLIAYDDEFLAIEMTIVSPPFCLDFGGAYLDEPPDYSDEVWADWREYKSELFEDNWQAVEEILAVFRSFGVYIADINPGNIRFK